MSANTLYELELRYWTAYWRDGSGYCAVSDNSALAMFTSRAKLDDWVEDNDLDYTACGPECWHMYRVEAKIDLLVRYSDIRHYALDPERDHPCVCWPIGDLLIESALRDEAAASNS